MACKCYVEPPARRRPCRGAHEGVACPDMHDPGSFAMRALANAERMHRGTLFLKRMCVVPHRACVHRASRLWVHVGAMPCQIALIDHHLQIPCGRQKSVETGDLYWVVGLSCRSSASIFGGLRSRRCLPWIIAALLARPDERWSIRGIRVDGEMKKRIGLYHRENGRVWTATYS